MVATVSGLNPLPTTNALGSFPSPDSSGWVQGTFLDDPAIRNELAIGVLDNSETIPMWGGVAIYENVPAAGGFALGGHVGRATNVTANASKTVTGFSVFNQAHAWVSTPQSPVPTAGSGMTVPFFRLGTGARIVVACDPDLVSLQSAIISPQVSWDFNQQLLQPYDASTATIAASSTVTWANTNGGQLTFPVSNWTGATQPVAGDSLLISGATNSGTGGTAAINTSFNVVSATSTQAVLAAPAASGVFGTIAGSPVLNFGTGALPVKILDIEVGNSMTVSYAAGPNFATWNRTGTTALILI